MGVLHGNRDRVEPPGPNLVKSRDPLADPIVSGTATMTSQCYRHGYVALQTLHSQLSQTLSYQMCKINFKKEIQCDAISFRTVDYSKIGKKGFFDTENWYEMILTTSWDISNTTWMHSSVLRTWLLLAILKILVTCFSEFHRVYKIHQHIRVGEVGFHTCPV